MKLRKLISTTAVALVVTAAAAQAATFAWTEGMRAQVAGTDLINPDVDATNSPPGFNIGTLGTSGGNIDVHGRIVSRIDFYEFTSDRAFRVDWLFGGYDLAAGEVNYPGDDNTVSGLTSRAFGNGDQSPVNVFLNGTASDGNTFTADIVGGDSKIFGRMAAGTYTLRVDGDFTRLDALYDIRIQAVPLPAGGLLLLTALGGLGIARRRRK